MHLLALDTSRFPGSLALLTRAECHRQATLPAEGKTAQTLFASVAEALAEQGWQPADIDLVAVTLGPGSFTGLRIGVTFAKTWAYARRCEVLGFETLDVIAEQCTTAAERLQVVLNAERRQLFVADYRPLAEGSPVPGARRWRREGVVEVVDRQRWAQQLVPGTTVMGDGLVDFSENLPAGVVLAQRDSWTLQAATLGRMAWHAYEAGQRGDLWRLVPQYYRASAAEEKRQARRALE